MAGAVSIAFGVLAATYIFLRFLLHLTQDAREPPAILTGLPFIGPILSMGREKFRFYPRLRDQTRLPIYTLRMPWSRLYIVNATSLIPVIQKQWRPISFAALTAQAGKSLGMSEKTVELMHSDLQSEDSFSGSWPRFVMPAISPGADLDDINRKSVQVYVSEVEKLQAGGAGPTRVGFSDWSREMMVESTGEAIWGPQNPLRDPIVRDAWKMFEKGYITLNLSPFPSLFFPKLFLARETVANAWIKYTRNGGYKTASALVRKRWEHHHGLYNFSVEDFGRGELGNAFAVLGNTTPCAFWVLYHVFSDDRVLNDVRSELEAVVQEVEEDGVKVSSIDLASIKDGRCPILMSTFQEVLRHRSVSISVRKLLEDVLLDDQYLLRKGNTLMIPNLVQHTDTVAWGDDAHQFDHLRFVPKSVAEKKRINRLAFRVFGGGRHLCPGRHFATTEIVSLAALLVLQFDVRPVGGKWVEPTFENSPLQAGFPHPDEDIPVDLIPRDANRKWRVTFSGDKVLNIVAEDIDDAA